jgi:hypothetical protein
MPDRLRFLSKEAGPLFENKRQTFGVAPAPGGTLNF